MLRGILAFIGIVFMVSCNNSIVKTEFKPTENGSWNKDSIMEFNFSGLDTIQKHHMFINVRNDNTFPYSNLFIIAALDYPNGETVTDTLEYIMAEPDGTWLGKGYGSIKENKLWYKENIVFPSSGVYTLRLSQAMRKNGNVDGIINLEGITDVGFEIVKSNE
ncbi:gliding motility lipoprotein GldH [Maribacter sp. TH_r10]|uniref:Gliding motility lipoprotein GldH n=1 Tax=Maribacter luteus TaxID=2594478 RepID=A0A6I2MKG1_9FLAO|nr:MULTISPECIES: gliding motility lipoprotein GldH [Maribacter]MDV7137531.1 gliding motility lipoprotein GldH [Maribacter sp. TH_r10]MRX64253.1 gliding motility lipoprotein GldH [Maribacter luteus]|tara:strand:- start:3155 stop:3640 length:486 start_codon:yes stop_codon:yes gene_type:complete